LPEDRFGAAPGSDDGQYRVHLCFGPNCTERGSRSLWPILEQAVREAGLDGRVELLATTCRNRCDDCPSLNVYPGPVFYNRIDRDAIQDIVDEHLVGDTIAEQWLYRPRIECRKRR
jgi:(2Fe-2S) ferredoxin